MDITDFINKYGINNISEKFKLRIKNDNTNYYMINYTQTTELTEPFLKYFSGVILEKTTNKILYFFNGKLKNVYYLDYIMKNIKLNDFYIKKIYIGPMIKIFNYNNKWFISTSYHTNIKRFYIEYNNDKILLYYLFKDIITGKRNTMTYFWKLLNKNYSYTFIINHKKIGYNSNNLFFISKYNLLENKEYDDFLFKKSINYKFNIVIPPVEKIEDYKIFNNLEKQKYILIEKSKKDGSIINRIEIKSN